MLHFILLHVRYTSYCYMYATLHTVTCTLPFILLHVCTLPFILAHVRYPSHSYMYVILLLHACYPSCCYMHATLHTVTCTLPFILLHVCYPSCQVCDCICVSLCVCVCICSRAVVRVRLGVVAWKRCWALLPRHPASNTAPLLFLQTLRWNSLRPLCAIRLSKSICS